MREHASEKKEPTSPARRREEGRGSDGEQVPVREMVARLAERDTEVWVQFWGRYAGRSLALVHGLIAARNWFALRGQEDDVLVESFEHLLRGIGKFRGTTYRQLDRFVWTNLVFACLRKLRELGPEMESLESVQARGGVAHESLPEILHCERILRAAIGALPGDLEVIVRLNLLGYSSLEVAARLRLTRQAVFNRKHRALRLLRDRLANERFWEECAAYVSELRLFREEGGA